MKANILFIVAVLTASVVAAADASTTSRFQVRLVRDSNAVDTELVKIPPIANDSKVGDYEVLHISKLPLLDHSVVRSASVVSNSFTGNPEISVEFTEEGRKKLAKLTQENVGKRVAVFIDGKVQSAPRILSPITAGRLAIFGPFNFEEANRLAGIIRPKSN